jgi:hypothetical protein
MQATFKLTKLQIALLSAAALFLTVVAVVSVSNNNSKLSRSSWSKVARSSWSKVAAQPARSSWG